MANSPKPSTLPGYQSRLEEVIRNIQAFEEANSPLERGLFQPELYRIFITENEDLARHRTTLREQVEQRLNQQQQRGGFFEFFRQAFNHHQEMTQPQENPLASNPHSISLLEIGYREDIPPEYVCPLSLEIIYDPVYAPNCPYAFEKNWILEHLRHNETNPLTRAPLTTAQLIPGIELRRRIEDFVHEKVDQHQPSSP